VLLTFYRSEVAEKLFEYNEGSHSVEFFNQVPEEILNQKIHPGVTLHKHGLSEKVLSAHASVNVPHIAFIEHKPYVSGIWREAV
jgi:hypothetical protein